MFLYQGRFVTQSVDVEFGWFRSFFWPIHRHEMKKLIPMVLMLFLICLNYSILRPIKDTVVVNTSGAKALPLIKIFGILPMAVVITFIFSKLVNRFSQERVFYIMITGFLSYYALYGFVLYPLHETLRPDTLVSFLQSTLPSNGFFKGMTAIIENWTVTSFYVMAELWSTAILQVLFWGFANEITKVTEARRFYAVLAVVSNFAAIIAGLTGDMLSHEQVFETQVMLILFVIGCGVATMGIFRWMNKQVLTSPEFDELHRSKSEMKSKKRISVRESLSYLSKSRYLLCIATLVVAYNLTINLVEVVWKDKLSDLYPSTHDYHMCLNQVTFYVGVVSTLVSFFLTKVIGNFGWTRAAIMTPLIMLVTSGGFFTFLFFEDSLTGVAMALFGTTPLALVAFFGAAQNVLSKASKYSLFDATKEMAFIPLDHESKLKGKAAIDGVGSRFGKSGGSFIHSGLLMIFDGVTQSAPVVAGVLGAMIGFWMMATRSLGKQFAELTMIKDRSHVDKREVKVGV
jgi:AAA family ATP:ADP antiporter